VISVGVYIRQPAKPSKAPFCRFCRFATLRLSSWREPFGGFVGSLIQRILKKLGGSKGHVKVRKLDSFRTVAI